MLAIRLCLTDNVYYRKLKKDADHHKLLAHTISKSFAAAISENEQLREFARMAHQSAQVSQAQAQASQQQNRYYQAEMHRLQKELDQSLQLTTKLQAAINEQPKQHPERSLLQQSARLETFTAHASHRNWVTNLCSTNTPRLRLRPASPVHCLTGSQQCQSRKLLNQHAHRSMPRLCKVV